MSFKTFIAAYLAVVAVGAAPATYFGDATYYIPNGGLGACGTPIQNTDFAVALSPDLYAGGANCGRRMGVNYQGLFVSATVADLCPGCGSGSIDLTPVAFQQLASLDAGRIQVSWDFQ
ncbi:riboflavin-aldehyde forming enzyme [Fomes fomentarius]|nr:riboflavin-aldehyde forming enzyme [Fomes fomentarius]